VTDASASKEVRLSELLGVLSLGADLGMGQPMEHAMRQCVIAQRMGERVGLSDDELDVVFHLGLLVWVGCHIDAYEQAKWFGDDLAMKGAARRVDLASMQGTRMMLRLLGSGLPVVQRARVGASFLGGGWREASIMIENHWYAADDLAGRLGLGTDLRDSLYQTFERWDGKGVPEGTKGEQILMTARLVGTADVLEVFHRSDGVEAAVAMARDRCGTQFDPALVEVVEQNAVAIFEDLDEAGTWDAVIAVPSARDRVLTGAQFDEALEAIADFTDVKSPYTLGHSRNVAELAGDAALGFGLTVEDAEQVRRAGLVHDLGRLGVSNSVWDKTAPLTPAEQERVRLHPYLGGRMLAASASLAPLGEIALQHHERLDGSGYPRGLRGDSLTPAGRVLAAADAYAGKTEPRPHRPALEPDEAAAVLRADAGAGRLDGGAVEAVLHSAGHPVRRRQDWPAGLTAREVEVLRLLARGLSNKQIAAELVISHKTASSHVEHIYTKIGVSNRARASVFALKHGLMSGPTSLETT
jgi:HD-GYP domain-containing protein (c-di-GMP phosphodiesterase class II)/DNA-binding CsgD family transcriptional regulator